MRTYPKQPEEEGYVFDRDTDPPIPVDYRNRLSVIRSIISEVLEERLPSCSTNKWFIPSVHFANMIDEIIYRIMEGIKF